jgi:cytochrome c556
MGDYSMLRVVSLVAALAVGGTFAYAQNLNVIKERKESMKAVGGAAGVGGKMMKGEEKFDLAKVQASLKTYQEQAAKQKALYPDDSKTGGETEALPAVFDKKADFLARLDKFASDAKAGAAAIKDEASFKTEWPKVMANCGGCHKEYRKPKQ